MSAPPHRVHPMVVRGLFFWTGAVVWACDKLLMGGFYLAHTIRLAAFRYTHVDLVWYIIHAARCGVALLGCVLKWSIVGIILVAYWVTGIPYAFALWFSIIFCLTSFGSILMIANLLARILGLPEVPMALPQEALLLYSTPHCHFG